MGWNGFQRRQPNAWPSVRPSPLDNVSRPEVNRATWHMVLISACSAMAMAVCDRIITGEMVMTKQAWGITILIGLVAFFREIRTHLNSGSPI